MKQITALLVALGFALLTYAQDSTQTSLPVVTDTLTPVTDTTVKNLPAVLDKPAAAPKEPKKNKWAQMNLSTKPKDHLMIQLGYNGWSKTPDTIHTKGLSRSFAMYFMFDLPFKGNPQYSVGVGVGISSSNMFFDKTYIDISGKSINRLSFDDVSDTTHFKKYKLVNTYLEAPVELRYVSDPSRPNKSWKAAIGIKVGTMLSATTKGKTFQSSSGQTINAYIQKEKAKRFFNGMRLSATGRIGLGAVSLFGTYQLNAFIKEGFGPDIRPYSVGLSFSGL